MVAGGELVVNLWWAGAVISREVPSGGLSVGGVVWVSCGADFARAGNEWSTLVSRGVWVLAGSEAGRGVSTKLSAVSFRWRR